tara:strand:+ start:704 stop:1447 length:744 start_codon:yes stop_codon:yes gene_type:complete
MSQETVAVSQVVNDFILTLAGDDYASNATDTAIRNFALRGIREMGFDMGQRIKTLELTVDASLSKVDLPVDFVALTKLGVVGSDGLVYSFVKNDHLNLLKSNTQTGFPAYMDAFESYVYRDYISNTSNGRLYGLGGGKGLGEYRINFEQNRIELSTNSAIAKVLIEYVGDEALALNPVVHVFAEEALRTYMYYKIIERKSNVPANEKSRARQEYYNERRKANARMKSFGKQDALAMLRKNFRQSPKY